MTLSTIKLTEDFQITIPSKVRRQLGLRAGDLVRFSVEGDRVVLHGVRGGWTESTRGLGAEMWRREGGAAAIERERDAWK
jgi:AbrB family looped-hinge helix DNA binding protein